MGSRMLRVLLGRWVGSAGGTGRSQRTLGGSSRPRRSMRSAAWHVFGIAGKVGSAGAAVLPDVICVMTTVARRH